MEKDRKIMKYLAVCGGLLFILSLAFIQVPSLNGNGIVTVATVMGFCTMSTALIVLIGTRK